MYRPSPYSRKFSGWPSSRPESAASACALEMVKVEVRGLRCVRRHHSIPTIGERLSYTKKGIKKRALKYRYAVDVIRASDRVSAKTTCTPETIIADRPETRTPPYYKVHISVSAIASDKKLQRNANGGWPDSDVSVCGRRSTKLFLWWVCFWVRSEWKRSVWAILRAGLAQKVEFLQGRQVATCRVDRRPFWMSWCTSTAVSQ